MDLIRLPIIVILCLIQLSTVISQGNRLGNFEEVFAWKQLTYNINGVLLQRDVNSEADLASISNLETVKNQDDSGKYFIRYNNFPMGVEKVGNRLFITVPKRRYGIPSTLNYIDLDVEKNNRSPALKPYPSVEGAKTLTTVYRPRADSCGRLWMIDTGRLELPNNEQQLKPPAIVVFNLTTNEQILRYEFKASDLPAEYTPTGLASLTVDVINNNCEDTYAYVPDLATFGLIVYSLRENDSWRLSHNYFHFDPTAVNLRVSGRWFQWNYGISSITLAGSGRCKVAYFHPLISTTEFSVSTCLLTNRTATEDPNYWKLFNILGERGENSQSTMHDYHEGTNVVFFAEIGRDSVSCWNAGQSLRPSNVVVLARDSTRMSFPSDLHVKEDEVWVLANNLPTFRYSTLNTNVENFFIYKGKVQDLIAGTPCEGINGNFRQMSLHNGHRGFRWHTHTNRS